jgi:hypothetical protein
MRTRGSWGLGLALLACLAAPAVADDSSPSWFSRWFSAGQKAPAKKADAQKTDDKERPVEPDVTNRPELPEGDPLTAERKREQANLLRRLLVCDKMEELTTDPDLLRQIDELRQRIQMTYAQRTAYMTAAGAHSVDEAMLEKHLGTGAGRRAEAPPYTVHGEDSIGRTASSEDKR